MNEYRDQFEEYQQNVESAKDPLDFDLSGDVDLDFDRGADEATGDKLASISLSLPVDDLTDEIIPETEGVAALLNDNLIDDAEYLLSELNARSQELLDEAIDNAISDVESIECPL